MEDLCIDIRLNIFSRLPTKSLMRFKCVSKSWLRTINHPTLPHMHVAQGLEEEPVILLVDQPVHPLTSIRAHHGSFVKSSMHGVSTLANSKNYILNSSCKGLLCFANSSEHDLPVIMFNPLKQEVLAVAPPPVVRFSRMYGLGFDQKNNTYKIMCVSKGWDSKKSWYEFCVNIYTFSTKSWRVVGNCPPCSYSDRPIFVHGTLFWAINRELDITGDYKDMILSFDIEHEEINLISHPGFEHYHLVDFGGSLSMVNCSSDEFIEIWILKDYKSEDWVLKHKIKIRAPSGFNDNSHIEVVGIWNDGEILLRYYFHNFFSYNPKTDWSRYIQIPGLEVDMGVYGFRGSLVSLSDLERPMQIRSFAL